MKKNGIVNENILRVIGSTGHTDMLVICDMGLPIPNGVEKIDLALVKGIPGFADTLEAVLKEEVVEKITIAAEIKTKSPGMYQKILTLAGEIPIEEVTHSEFKAMTAGAKAIIRTGEATPYSNVILHTGVNF